MLRRMIILPTNILSNMKNKKYANELRKNMTKQEKHLWYDFLKKHRYYWYRQRMIGNYIVDFYCDYLHLVIELDGNQHCEETAIAYDLQRTAMLNAHGIEVLRFSNIDIDRNFDAVCQYIENYINKRYK